MKNLKSIDWWDKATVRALKTGAQAVLAVLGSGIIGVLDVDWLNLLSITLMSMFVSYVTSLAGLPEVEDGSDNAD